MAAGGEGRGSVLRLRCNRLHFSSRLFFLLVVVISSFVSGEGIEPGQAHEQEEEKEPQVQHDLGHEHEHEHLLARLPYGDINLVVLTDVHSWIGGHGRHPTTDFEPYYDNDTDNENDNEDKKRKIVPMDVDYGDVLSFYEQLQAKVDIMNQKRKVNSNNDDDSNSEYRYHKDLFLVNNGDFVDGTGLSTIPPKFLTPILQQMPFDIINCGNHELYHEETISWIHNHFINHWDGHYLTSNVLYKPKKGHSNNNNDEYKPLGSRYVFLKRDSGIDNVMMDNSGTNENAAASSSSSKSTILVFGFLYDFKNAASNVIVEKVEDVVQQEWFRNVIIDNYNANNNYDAILVMAHMHVTNPLIDVILQAIRTILQPFEESDDGMKIPIQFITGHTHIRANKVLDDYSSSFEAGRFLDTIGFVSFPTKQTIQMNRQEQQQQQQEEEVPLPPHDNNAEMTIAAAEPEPETELQMVPSTPTSSSTKVGEELFRHVFLDANRKVLEWIITHDNDNDRDIENHPTDEETKTKTGIALSKRLHQQQEKLGLLQQIGCSKYTYSMTREMDFFTSNNDDNDNDIDTTSTIIQQQQQQQQQRSLWGLYMYHIVPKYLHDAAISSSSTSFSPLSWIPSLFSSSSSTTDADEEEEDDIDIIKTIFVQGTGALRYDLFAGPIVVDDIISVCPFDDIIYQITPKHHPLTGRQLLRVFNLSIKGQSSSATATSTASIDNNNTAATIRGKTTNSKKKKKVLINPNDMTQVHGNENDNKWINTIPKFAFSATTRTSAAAGTSPFTPYINLNGKYHLLTGQFHVKDFTQRVQNLLGLITIPEPQPIRMTTNDDDNNDNDIVRRQRSTTTTTTNRGTKNLSPLTYWTTTNLWMKYMQDEWNNNDNGHCHTDSNVTTTSHSNVKTTLMASGYGTHPVTVAVINETAKKEQDEAEEGKDGSSSSMTSKQQQKKKKRFLYTNTFLVILILVVITIAILVSLLQDYYLFQLRRRQREGEGYMDVGEVIVIVSSDHGDGGNVPGGAASTTSTLIR